MLQILGRLTDAINKRFSLSSGLTVANRLGAVFLMGIMFVVVARVLGPEGQGIVSTLVVVITIAIQFGNMGLYASNIRFVGGDRKLYSKAAGNSLTIGGFLGITIAVLIIVSYLVFPSFFPDIPFYLLVIYAFSLPFSLEIILFQGMLLAVQDIVKYNILIFLRAAALVGGVMVLLLGVSGGITELVIFLAFVEFLFALTYIAVAYKIEPFKFALDIDYLKKMIGYGFKVYLATQITFLVLKFDVFMVNYYLGASSAGIYSVSSKLADMIKMIPETIALIFFPMATALGDRAKPFANKVLIGIAVMMLFICGGVYLMAESVTLGLFGDQYEGSIIPVLILIPGIYLISLEVLLMNYFASKKMPLKVVIVPVIGLIVNVGLNIAWLPVYGINAAAWTSTISYGIMFILLFAMYLKSE